MLSHMNLPQKGTMQLPKFTQPLEKGFRTTEGIASAVVASLISLMSLVSPASLPHREGALLLAGLTGLYTAQRGLIKVAAVTKGTVGPPIDPEVIDKLTSKLDDVISTVGKVNIDPEDLVDLEMAAAKIGKLTENPDLLRALGQLANPLAYGSGVSTASPTSPSSSPAEPELEGDAAIEAKVESVTDIEEESSQPPVEHVVRPDSALKPDGPDVAKAAASANRPIDAPDLIMVNDSVPPATEVARDVQGQSL
jgi:hypothetical protein